MPAEKLRARIAELSEFNPMLGFRGCRLGIRYPEITEMQARAIFEAALNTGKETGKPVKVEVMVPLVAYRREFDIVREIIVQTSRAVETEEARQARLFDRDHDRAAACGAESRRDRRGRATGAQFFSFGTNDLTQTTLGLSRDDAGADPR